MSPQLRPSTLMGRLQPLAAGSWQRFKLAGFAEPLTMVFPRGAAHGRAQGWLLPCLCSFRAGMLVAGTAAALPAAGHRAAAPQAPNLLFFISMQSTRNGKSRQGLCFSSSLRSAGPWPLLELARFMLHVLQAAASHPGISLLTEGFQPHFWPHFAQERQEGGSFLSSSRAGWLGERFLSVPQREACRRAPCRKDLFCHLPWDRNCS